MSIARFPDPAGARLFISYRRDDTAGYARALTDLLAQQFGARQVFIDVDGIAAGQAFDQAIAQAVGSARVLLVLIGPRWLAPDADGRPRLHGEADFVRREVAAGLAGGLQVIPLLFDGATMPSAAQLPADLRPLATRQALVMDARRFAADTAQLLAVLRPAMGGPPSQPAPAARRAWLAGVAAAALGLGGAAWWATRQPPPAAARPPVNGRWQADVSYDWPGAQFREQLVLQGDGHALTGTVSFLRVPRGIEDGQVDADGLRFSTRSTEQLGGSERTVTHRYRGVLVGDVLQLTMQTEGAAQPHRPVEIQARRVAAQ